MNTQNVRVKFNKFWILCVCVCVLLATIPCSMSESWVDVLQTMDIDHYGPRICCLLLRISKLNPPHPLFLFSDFWPRGQPTPDPPPHPYTSALLLYRIIRQPRRPLYPYHHIKNTSSRTGSSVHLYMRRFTFVFIINRFVWYDFIYIIESVL